MPVPPLVRTTSAPSATASRSAVRTGSPSGTTTRAPPWQPRSRRPAHRWGYPTVSPGDPRALRVACLWGGGAPGPAAGTPHPRPSGDGVARPGAGGLAVGYRHRCAALAAEVPEAAAGGVVAGGEPVRTALRRRRGRGG